MEYARGLGEGGEIITSSSISSLFISSVDVLRLSNSTWEEINDVYLL